MFSIEFVKQFLILHESSVWSNVLNTAITSDTQLRLVRTRHGKHSLLEKEGIMQNIMHVLSLNVLSILIVMMIIVGINDQKINPIIYRHDT